MAVKNGFYKFVALLAISSILLGGEAECKTRLVMGRKTITRTYYKEPAIPAWATVLLIGIGMLIMGGLLYVLLQKVYLHDEKYYSTMHRAPEAEYVPA